MLPMTITVSTISPTTNGTVRALVHVQVPQIGARARIVIGFDPEPGSGPADWREEAYDRALSMLDPA